MRNITLKTVNNETGELIQETNLLVKEGSILINKVPMSITIQKIKYIHDSIAKCLEDNKNIITIPNICELQVLEIE